MASFTALLDACVLYPAPLRDFLLHLALTGLFRARWSDAIHEEWIRNLLINRPDLNRGQLERTRLLMNRAVPDCLVTGYEQIIPALQLPDPDDRHVLAAAICAGAEVIVTFNEKDFPSEALSPFGLRTEHPDEFIGHLFSIDFGAVCEAAKRQRTMLKNPPRSVDEFLETIESQGLPQTAAQLRGLAGLL